MLRLYVGFRPTSLSANVKRLHEELSECKCAYMNLEAMVADAELIHMEALSTMDPSKAMGYRAFQGHNPPSGPFGDSKGSMPKSSEGSDVT